MRLEPVAWTPLVSETLRRSTEAAGDGFTVDALGAMVRRGACGLYQLDAFPGAYVVLRAETTDCVIVSAGGPNGFKALRAALPHIEALARHWGCKALRTHVTRPGMVRVYRGLGFTQDAPTALEIVLRRHLTDGR